ncbi:hypothetical protein [Streptomyces sp. SID3343]|uniref:hypothetical protein n=1 Tax=Streptomyces sp. SID3343 TaxID=2690260 RepID=UPI00136D9711|nr:hypothetical protein [Streptomyces sp. SID3343]MYW02182.1 hypothetical protein [Streptomyces sp. SID3343]
MAKRLNPGVAVSIITIAALVGVGFLAAQAANSAPEDRQIARPTTAAPTGTAAPGEPAPPPKPTTPPIPADSGTGKRVVYSIQENRVWLVSEAEISLRDYPIAPAPVKPTPGAYSVTIKTEEARKGSDNLTITHSVRFGYVQGIPLGFAATDTPLDKIAVPKSTATGTAKPKTPPAAQQSAGIRSTPADGTALWNFAPIGTPVVVVP